jgi:uncharacterized alpha/beta hydrolase family protein
MVWASGQELYGSRYIISARAKEIAHCLGYSAGGAGLFRYFVVSEASRVNPPLLAYISVGAIYFA